MQLHYNIPAMLTRKYCHLVSTKMLPEVYEAEPKHIFSSNLPAAKCDVLLSRRKGNHSNISIAERIRFALSCWKSSVVQQIVAVTLCAYYTKYTSSSLTQHMIAITIHHL